MKIRFLILMSFLMSMGIALADTDTNRLMSKIIRDTNNYICADVRGASEDEAYEEALGILAEKITSYYKEKGMGMPDAVYLSNLSNHSERLISQSGSERCRVVVYVNKKDLFPIGDQSNSVMLSKDDKDQYTVMSTSSKTDGTSAKAEASPKAVLSPALSRIAMAKTSKDVQSLLVSMKKENALAGAAAFPVANVSDFYVVLIDRSDTQVALLHCLSGEWTNAVTGEKADMKAYKYCSGYWLTLP